MKKSKRLPVRKLSKPFGELDIKLKSDFGKIKKKIFFKIILSTILTSIIGLVITLVLIDGALQEPFANFFVSLTRRLFQVDREQACLLYTSRCV